MGWFSRSSDRSRSPSPPEDGYPSSSRGSSPSSQSESSDSHPSPAVRGVRSLQILDQGHPEDPDFLLPIQLGFSPKMDLTYKAIAFAVDLGLSMLESRRGRASLEDVAGRVSHGMLKEDDRPEFVSVFLQKMRQDFPNVIITDRIEHKGEYRRLDREGGVALLLNKSLVEQAVNAGIRASSAGASAAHRENHQKFLFMLGETVAQELVNTLVGYMTAETEDNKPLNYGSERLESGQAWESRTFGLHVGA